MTDTKPCIFPDLYVAMIEGRFDARDKECQMYLGYTDGTVHEETRKEIGKLMYDVSSDVSRKRCEFLMDWPSGQYDWIVERICNAAVIKTDDQLLAYFDLGLTLPGSTVSIKLLGGLEDKCRPVYGLFDDWHEDLNLGSFLDIEDE